MLMQPHTCFSVLFIYFICSQLMPTGTFLYHVGFYGLLLPAFLWLLYRQRHSITWHVDVGSLSLAVFFAFVVLHALTLQPAEQSLAKTLHDTLWNVLFVAMAYQFFHFRSLSDTTLLKAFILTTIVFGCVSMTYYEAHAAILASGHTPPRPWMIGRAHNPIPIGNLYTMATLMAVWLFFQPTTKPYWSGIAIACGVVTFVAIMLSTQRGPLLALVVASLASLVIMRQWRWLLAVAVPLLVLGMDFLYFSEHHRSILGLEPLQTTIANYTTYRDSSRGAIWAHAFELIARAPLQGYGLQAKFLFEPSPDAVNPHNVFLSTLYYLGIPGLGLLLMPLIAAFSYAWRGRRSPYYQLCLILLIHAVVATFTNYGQVVKEPAPLWTIYWLPIVMAMARRPDKLGT